MFDRSTCKAQKNRFSFTGGIKGCHNPAPEPGQMATKMETCIDETDKATQGVHKLALEITLKSAYFFA